MLEFNPNAWNEYIERHDGAPQFDWYWREAIALRVPNGKCLCQIIVSPGLRGSYCYDIYVDEDETHLAILKMHWGNREPDYEPSHGIIHKLVNIPPSTDNRFYNEVEYFKRKIRDVSRPPKRSVFITYTPDIIGMEFQFRRFGEEEIEDDWDPIFMHKTDRVYFAAQVSEILMACEFTIEHFSMNEDDRPYTRFPPKRLGDS